jgi:mono/diheme cytochrome c family protein
MHRIYRLGLLAVLLLRPAAAAAQAPAPPVVPIGPRPNAGPPDRPPVDRVAADRGRALYGVECITCHGSTARGTATAPSLIRSGVVLNDRYGSTLGPFFKSGHPMQSGGSSTALTTTQVVDLMHFLRQRINDTLRGSDVFTVQNILVGNAKAGESYFAGGDRCTTCHSATGDLAGIASRVPVPVDLQQRMLFPTRRSGTPVAPSRSEITVTVATSAGAPVSGVWITEDDFYVTLLDKSGVRRVIRKTPGVTVTAVDPLQAHHELLDRVTDTQIHDLVAYLVTLK